MTEQLSFPVSMAQQGMWLSETLFSGTGHNHVCQGFCINKSIRNDLIEQAVSLIVQQQESLRTVFKFQQGEVKQYILPELDWHIEQLECVQSEQTQLVRRLTRETFSLSQAPLFRVIRLVQPEQDKLLFIFHHIITDGWSADIFKRQLWQNYQQLAQGITPQLEELELQYGDFAEWQIEQLAEQQAQQQLAYWREQLANVTPCTFPADKVRPAQPSFQGKQLEIALPKQLVQGVNTLAQQQQTSAFNIYLSAFKVLISRYTRQEDITVGSPVAGRDMAELEPIIGYFVNTVVYRTQCDMSQSFSAYLEQVKNTVLDAWEYQQLPFAKLVSDIYGERSLDTSPFFQLMFAYYRHDGDADEQMSDLGVSSWQLHNDTSKFDLTLSLEDNIDAVSMALEYSTELFEVQSIERIAAAYTQLLASIIAAPNLPLYQLPLLDEEAKNAQLARYASTSGDYSSPFNSICEGFEQMVARFENNEAIVDGERTLTYQQLNVNANQLARHLLNVQPQLGLGSKVAICLSPSVNTMVAILAVLKVGAAYVPIDPSAGQQRLEYILDDANVDVVIGNQDSLALFAQRNLQLVCLDTHAQQIASNDDSNLNCHIERTDQAYMIYTSGSTGKPKGVKTTHHNVLRLFSATDHWFEFNSQDVWSLFHSCVFDFSVWEMWGALLYGAKLVVIPKEVTRAPDVFAQWVEKYQITVLNQTPSAFKQYAAIGKPYSLRYVIFGGEALDIPSVSRWFEQYSQQQPKLINMYGITETTVHVTYQELSAELLKGRIAAPIGEAIPDLSMYVLDPWLQPVPDGMTGELFVSGDGVADGYHNRAQLSAERFLNNPFNDAQPTLYRSGDLVKVDNQGELIYQGRADHQVKIRGFRIELGEIENALLACNGIKEALVLAHEAPQQGAQLVAYVVCDALSVQALREQLAKTLPEYMIPAIFMPLTAFPLTINGKIDRRALPEPKVDRSTLTQEFVAPSSAIEVGIAKIWQQVLNVDSVSVNDNFFALGGDSLRAVQVNELLEQQGISLPLEQIFKTQTIKALAEYLSQHDADSMGVVKDVPAFSMISEEQRAQLPEDVIDAYPLSGMQAGMFYHMMLAPESNIYHCTGTSHICLDHKLNEALFYEAVQELVAHHEILRTGFDLHNEYQPIQCVHAHALLPVEFSDITSLDESQQEAQVMALIEQEKASPFDLTKPTLLRFFIQHRSATSFQFTMTECHPIFDGWSYHSLIVDVFNLYAEKMGRRAPTALPQLNWRYADFVATEKATINNPQSIDFWTNYLADFEPLALPLQSDAMCQSKQLRAVHLRIEDNIYNGLKALMKQANVPLKSVLLAGHIKVMSLVSSQHDVLTGIPTNGRYEGKGGDKQYGLFINTLPFRQKLKDGTWQALIQDTFALECDLIPHRRFPLAEVQRLVGRETALLEDVLFNYMDFHVYEALCPELGLTVKNNLRTDQVHEGTNFALTVHFQHLTLSSGLKANDVSLQLDYDNDLLTREQVVALGELYMAVFAQMADNAHAQHQEFGHSAVAITQRLATVTASDLAQLDSASMQESVTEQAEQHAAEQNGEPIEQALLEGVRRVWHELLQAQVSDTDNFFDAGGHSLLFLPLLTKLKALPEQGPMSDESTVALKAITTLDLINYPSIERFCQFICGTGQATAQADSDKAKNKQDARARMLKLRNRQGKRA
ncbi:non-ribosomal peptide synthetase [Pseudoalteromonas sp. S16_S37]|uniref:non-ribosomal peptide synthetase n=1 Tax=Pseudoalteromonas sp. S16_S37 TaxID=2720228 RepID=UPI0016802161|nr:non-ribosomal peptide synthetase [Pseudoalteromonas sp. S16_S37]MBD1580778.1 amino acid adenylation domain-containing protein [Pseudoalteromonas sp. S16_S37]